jgi:dGTPase
LTREGRPTARYAARGVPAPILAYDRVQPLELASFASAEAQVAAIADDVAYDAHDIDDGLRADLFTLEDIAAVPLVGAIVVEIDRQAPRLDPARRVHELIRRLITRMIEEVTAESLRRLAALMPQSVADIRAASEQVIAFSPAMQAGDKAIKGFLYPRMYRHERVMRVMDDAEQVVRDLYGHFAANPADLPAEWGEGLNDAATRARRIADYIAGMTDRYALIEHARLFPATPELR